MKPIKMKKLYEFNFGKLSSRQRDVIDVDSWGTYPEDIVESGAYSMIQAISQVAQKHGGMAIHKIDEMEKYANDFITEVDDILPKNSVIINWLADYFARRDIPDGYGRFPRNQQVEIVNEFYETHRINKIVPLPPKKSELVLDLRKRLAQYGRNMLTGMYHRIERKMLEEQEKQAELERTEPSEKQLNFNL